MACGGCARSTRRAASLPGEGSTHLRGCGMTAWALFGPRAMPDLSPECARLCSLIQRRRARATSARSCSAARNAFFERDLVTLKEPPHRGAAAWNLVPTHRRNHFIQRQVRLLIDQGEQKLRMLLQR